MTKNVCNHKPNRREDWGTPPGLFNDLDEILGFEIDLAATKENALCKEFVSPEQDFLSIKSPERLTDGWAWCNPPYGKRGCGAWVKQILKMRKSVTLVPASVGTQWFAPVWDLASYVFFIRGRLRFVGAPGPAQFDSCLVIKGDLDLGQYKKLDAYDRGALVELSSWFHKSLTNW